AGYALRWRKVWDEGVAVLVGFIAGLGAVYLSWAAWLYGHLGGLVGLLDLASSPARLWHLLCEINTTGSWDIWGYNPTGFALWLVWSAEAALIVGLSAFFSFHVVVEKGIVFCGRCGTT